MHYQDLIDRYIAGAETIADSIRDMSAEQIDARPIAGRWSTRQVVCHVADFEPIYADRMKRVIAERCPTFFGGDPDTFAASLAYDQRAVEPELAMIAAVRRHMAAILKELNSKDFERVGNHAEAGPLTLETLLLNITDHIPHHVRFIDEKRKALGV